MNLRDIFVSVTCCAAAVCLGFGKPARAGELQSSNETASRATERCAALQPGVAPVEETAGCERIGGHLRVEFGSRMSNASGYGRPGASPVAVRLDEGTPRGHLRLPAGESGMEPFAR
ncbi:MAG: hypothetical protein ACREC9_03615 [Methylocella sp.]